MLTLYALLSTLKTTVSDRIRDEETGGVAIEYALLAALVALAIVAGATLLGTEINDMFSRIGAFLSGRGPA